MFVFLCHLFDNDHVKGNFILFSMNIKVMVTLWGKTSYYYFDWTPTFAVLAKIHYFFGFSVKFKIVQMVFVLLCHQLENIHVKENFIFFAMTIESL